MARRKEINRLRNLFNVDVNTMIISEEQVTSVLVSRGYEEEQRGDSVNSWVTHRNSMISPALFHELRSAHVRMLLNSTEEEGLPHSSTSGKLTLSTESPEDFSPTNKSPTNKSPSKHRTIALEVLVDLMLQPEIFLQHVAEDSVEDVSRVIAILGRRTVNEVVEDETRIGAVRGVQAELKNQSNWEWPLTVVVSITVIVSLLAMGLNLDSSDPESLGWVLLEVACTTVFITEAVVKIRFWGLKYFRGESAYWNIADLVITAISVLELVVTASIAAMKTVGSEEKITKAARVTVLMRALRCVRVVRLVKLLHSPFLRDLANMMVGFVLGIPSLIWVLLVFLVILYMLGLVFRQVLGPDPGRELLAGSTCPLGDDVVDLSDPICEVHRLYGEEFFGTVSKSMFTAFRFMLGDYSSRGGKSLVVAFSSGYGKLFEVTFVTWMVVVLFGIFNIITAIFVDSTISGLKHNDVRRKYNLQYEREYVRSKLKELLCRIHQLHAQKGWNSEDSRAMNITEVGLEAATEIQIDEEEFAEVMEDSTVVMLLQDLDISMFNPAGLFHTFDPDGDGKVTVHELVQAVMKLRGEPQKGDTIATWVSLRALHEKIDGFHKALVLADGGPVLRQELAPPMSAPSQLLDIVPCEPLAQADPLDGGVWS